MTDLAPALVEHAWQRASESRLPEAERRGCWLLTPRHWPIPGQVDLAAEVDVAAADKHRAELAAQREAAAAALERLFAPALADAPKHNRLSLRRRASLAWGWIVMPLHD
jgi:hypothetical protein